MKELDSNIMFLKELYKLSNGRSGGQVMKNPLKFQHASSKELCGNYIYRF